MIPHLDFKFYDKDSPDIDDLVVIEAININADSIVVKLIEYENLPSLQINMSEHINVGETRILRVIKSDTTCRNSLYRSLILNTLFEIYFASSGN